MYSRYISNRLFNICSNSYFFALFNKTSILNFKVNIPLPSSQLDTIRAYKQSKRKSDDIALVNACFRVKLFKEDDDDKYKIVSLDVALGGVSFKTIYLHKLNALSRGLHWGDAQALKQIEANILDELDISYSSPGANPTYRRALVLSFLTRFWYQTIRDLKIASVDLKNAFSFHNIDEIKRGLSSSRQDVLSTIEPKEAHLGSVKPHVAALLHTTGTATYTDDIPKQNNELYAYPVMSTKAHALITSIDESQAVRLKGVHAFISHKDIPNSNIWGLGNDDEYFASKKVIRDIQRW